MKVKVELVVGGSKNKRVSKERSVGGSMGGSKGKDGSVGVSESKGWIVGESKDKGGSKG